MPEGVLVIDKAADWTSHDVVAKLRGLLREKRIGHGGTLDPMATGVLPVFLGRATRAVEFAASGEKEYHAVLRLGIETDTQDITGTPLCERDADVARSRVEEALARFRGEISQVPPMYSAIKKNGRPLYELARRGETVERAPRSVTIVSLELGEQVNAADWALRVVCSKGTYIRTLCHDIGAALGCGGCMAALRRVRVGGFSLGEAVTLDEVAQAAERGEAEALLRNVDTCFSDRPRIDIAGEDERRCRNGNDFSAGGAPGEYRVYGEGGAFLMLGRLQEGRMYTVKSFFGV